MIRSVLAVLAGIVVLTVASFAIEAALNPLLMRAFPGTLPDTAAIRANACVRGLMFVYGFACVAAGGYVAARIATRRPMLHAAVMGALQAGLTIMAMLSPEGYHASRWQWIVTAALSIPAALTGGAIYKGRRPDDRVEDDTARA